MIILFDFIFISVLYISHVEIPFESYGEKAGYFVRLIWTKGKKNPHMKRKGEKKTVVTITIEISPKNL